MMAEADTTRSANREHGGAGRGALQLRLRLSTRLVRWPAPPRHPLAMEPIPSRGLVSYCWA